MSHSPRRHRHRRLRQRPSGLALAVAAAIAAAAAGVVVATVVGGPAPPSSTGSPDAFNGAGAAGAAVHPARDAGGASGLRQPVRAQRQARQAAPRHAAAPASPAKPYLMYDSVMPSAIPANQVTATYATGPYAVSPAQVAGRRLLWIDVTGNDPAAGALDVEPTDATPTQAANWAEQRLRAHPHALARIYTARGEWPAVQAAVATLPGWMQSHVRWWIADPTGYPHILPGSDATQWYWGHSYDISTATPRF